MNIKTAYEIIIANINTLDDTNGYSINPILPNKVILQNLSLELTEYAQSTKGIQDVYYNVLGTTQNIEIAPPYALRAESFFSVNYWDNSEWKALGILSPFENQKLYNISTTGTPLYLTFFNGGKSLYYYVSPYNITSAQTTTIAYMAVPSGTSIKVVSTSGFPPNGAILLGTTVLLYKYKDATNFYGITLTDIESAGTIPTYTEGLTITNCNLQIFYARLPKSFAVETDGSISVSTLAQELEPRDDHMTGILKAVTYKLLMLLNDINRALIYKADFQELYRQYALDINKSYSVGYLKTNNVVYNDFND